MQKLLLGFFLLGVALFGNEVQQAMSDESWEKMKSVSGFVDFAPYILLCVGAILFFSIIIQSYIKSKDK